MKNSKIESVLKMVAFDFHLIAVLVVLFVFAIGAQAIARSVGHSTPTGELTSMDTVGR